MRLPSSFAAADVRLWLFVVLVTLSLSSSSSFAAADDAAEDGVCTTSTSADGDDSTCGGGQDEGLALAISVLESLKATKGAYVNDKLEVRRQKQDDWTSDFALFATDDIQENELLLKLPSDAYILIDAEESNEGEDDDDDDDDEYEQGMCDLKNAMLEEIRKGDDSSFAIYVKFLQATQEQIVPRMASLWSAKGKEMLEQMLYDPDIDSENSLPPQGATQFFHLGCWNANDPDDILATATAFGRGWDVAITPVFDFITHDNRDEKINVENTSVRNTAGFAVTASDPITVGEQLYHSFDRCVDCGDGPQVWGTPEIFRDKGYVEEYPQRFHFGGSGVMPIVSLDVTETGEVNEDGQKFFVADWIYGQLPLFGSYYGGIRFMKEHLSRLEDYYDNVLKPANGTFPNFEYEAIVDYWEALHQALSMGVLLGEQEYWESKVDYSENIYDPSQKFVTPEEKYIVDDMDIFRRTFYQAETLVYDTEHYNIVSVFNSQYQRIDHYVDNETRDMCFNLDTIFQMCRSYWPYYHEVQVHKAAKYVKEDIKRVLFVGAGDNGLLNEIVKYPTLELVVGLELDQHVARLAFKYFGAQTHYQNEKVQWWYGDASKTLYMLPREYFGSFDLVLVDLSDTIFSLTVSDELDVVGALSLLVKPNGIFAMNELFFKKVSDVFEYALYYQIYDMPKLGEQGFVIASNDVNLLNQDLTNHKVKDVLVEDTILMTEHQFQFVHDYRHNPSSTFDKLCKKRNEMELGDDDYQHTSPGIFMALEAEALTNENLQNPSKMKEDIEKALETNGGPGMHVISTTAGKKTDTQFVIILKEGYIAVRLDAEAKYCGFDILLWSSFDQFEAVKSSLVKAVGGTADSKTTSFRIVTDGMFGVSTWKEDEEAHGPRIDRICSEKKAPVRAEESPEGIFDVILNESVDLVYDDTEFGVAVLCGTEAQACKSVDALQSNKKISFVVPFYACADESLPSGDGDDADDSEDAAEECAKSTAKEKMEEDAELFLDEGKRIKFVVVDPSATIAMDGILSMLDEESKLEDDVHALATIDSHEDLWKRSTIDHIRTHVTRLDPVFRAHVLFNNTQSSLEMAIASSGNELFIDHLKTAVSSMEKKSGLTAEIRNIFGGLWKDEPKYIIEDDEGLKFFKVEDFDLSASLEQYKTQKPVGAQSIIQYTNVKEDRKTKIDPEDLKKGFDKVALTEHVEGDPFVESYENVGDGSIHIAIWDSGMILFVWDGRFQVDVNTFCANRTILDAMQVEVEQALPALQIKLRDFHPRGYGQVVNFEEDLKELEVPHWA